MVKTHVLTDRSYRYEKRTNMSNMREIQKTKTDKRRVQLILNKAVTTYNQMKNSYNFLYRQYCNLYDLHLTSDNQNTNLINSYNTLEADYYEKCDEYEDLSHEYGLLKNSHTDLNETYNNLNSQHTELKTNYDRVVNVLMEQCNSDENEDQIPPSPHPCVTKVDHYNNTESNTCSNTYSNTSGPDGVMR